MVKHAWYWVLQAAKAAKQPFTGAEIDCSSAYLAKLCNWGYLKRAGARTRKGERWKRLYVVTPWGKRVREPKRVGPFPASPKYPDRAPDHEAE